MGRDKESAGVLCELGRAPESEPSTASAPVDMGATASGVVTRICGAPHCGQNGTPSSTGF